MTRRAAILSVLSVAAASVAVWSYRALRDSSYELVATQRSPSGMLTIAAFRSVSEAGHAPYGDHLVLSPEPHIRRPSDGYVVFAGYCSNELRFSWTSDTEVVIQCDTKESNPVVTLASRAGRVDFRFELVQEGR